jgi:flagellar biosynthetic protein FlhB
VLLLLGALLLLTLGGRVVGFCAGLMRRELEQVATLSTDQSSILAHWQGIVTGLAGAMLPIFGLILLAAVSSNILQVGFLFVPERIKPDVNRISPAQGFRRIFSLTGTMRLGFGLFKVLIIGIVAGAVLWARRDDVLRAGGLDMLQLSHLLIDITLKTVLWVAAALVLLAIFEYALQRWKHEQDLMMTHQEVREEMKNLQGDPQIVARRRQIQRQMALNRISSSVPKADVVITNPTELAVALQYEPHEMAAPIVVAKGAGVLAQRIRRLALENNVPIVERKPLAQLLYKEVEVGRPVPTESYAAVAEVLAYVYQLKGKTMPAPPQAA